MAKKRVSKKDIVIIGGGGHAKVVIDAILASGEFRIHGIVDKDRFAGASGPGIKVVGDDSVLPKIFSDGVRHAIIGVGSIGNCATRKKIYADLKRIGFRLPFIVHPRAVVARGTELGEGAFVAAGVIINPDVKIGRNAIINTSASIDHDCIIGDLVHVAPGVKMSGGVRVGTETHIGTGAVVIQSVRIGKGCMVAAGSTIRHDMKDGQTSFGSAKENAKRYSVYIIAEAGVNHNGELETALKMIEAAKGAGADAVKFQAFNAAELARADAPKAAYQKKGASRNEGQLGMLKRLELGGKELAELARYCRRLNIDFIASPFDMKSIGLLSRIGTDTYKIPSGEIINMPYLKKIGSLKKKVILSTGMATMQEIDEALEVLTSAGTKKEDITVLHCTTEYPAPFGEINLKAMLAVKSAFNVAFGYSDHSAGIEVPIAAAALGANVLEKHFTLDKNMTGPDHKASLEPDEFKAMVRSIRNIEKALGTGIKIPTRSELKNMPIVRKSIVAAKDIKKGEVFTEKNLTAKRGKCGISPMSWEGMLGLKAGKAFKKDEAIRI